MFQATVSLIFVSTLTVYTAFLEQCTAMIKL